MRYRKEVLIDEVRSYFFYIFVRFSKKKLKKDFDSNNSISTETSLVSFSTSSGYILNFYTRNSLRDKGQIERHKSGEEVRYFD